MGKIPRKSFEFVYHKFALPLTKFIIKRTGGNQEAVEEVFSRTIVAAWKGYKTFQHKSSYFTWLCQISLHKIADCYKQEIHRESTLIAPLLEDLVSPDELSLEEKLSLKELKTAVNACLNLLSPQFREVLHLRFWKDLTIKEIARKLSISERAAEGKIYRAKKAFLKEVASNPDLKEQLKS